MSNQEKITIESDYGLKFKPILQRIKEKVRFLTRRSEKGIINKKTGAALSMRDDGTVGVLSTPEGQYKIGKDKASEIAHTSVTKTNRRILETDDLMINGHKLNPQVYEWGDMVKTASGDIVGNLTMDSTVLVKAWEPTLEKYVLIRRPARTALFYQGLNTAPIHPGFGVDDSLEEEFGAMEKEEQDAALIEEVERRKE